MGCGVSTHYFSAEVIPCDQSTHIKDFVDFVNTEYPLYSDHGLLKTLEMLLYSKLQSVDDCIVTIKYLETLLGLDDDFQLFIVATQIMIESNKIWRLEQQSLRFFALLKDRNPEVFFSLLNTLESLTASDSRGLYLKSDHIDTVIHSLQLQRHLPADSLVSLDAFLIHCEPDMHAIINSIHEENARYLTDQADAHNLLHHTLYHAAEIKVRSMYVLQNQLGLFSTQSPRDVFLHAITSLAIEYHDHEQKILDGKPSVEHVTAARVTAWITEALGITTDVVVGQLIEFLVDRIIILGTTMIYSPTSTMDLSELIVLFEKAMESINIPVSHPENSDFFKVTSICALLVGVMDKSPAAFYDVVSSQTSHLKTSSLINIRRYTPHSHLNDFFMSPEFEPYFLRENAPRAVNHEAFLIAIVPHLCMRTELSVGKHPVHARSIIQFVKSCQAGHAHIQGDYEFLTWFNHEFTRCNVAHAVENIFFSAIHEEAKFCKSLTNSIAFVHHRLRELAMASTEHEVLNTIREKIHSLIDPSVPQCDAKNLRALLEFYENITIDKKHNLIKELMLTVILQAGTIYATNADLLHNQRSSSLVLQLTTPKSDVPSGRFFDGNRSQKSYVVSMLDDEKNEALNHTA